MQGTSGNARLNKKEAVFYVEDNWDAGKGSSADDAEDEHGFEK